MCPWAWLSLTLLGKESWEGAEGDNDALFLNIEVLELGILRKEDDFLGRHIEEEEEEDKEKSEKWEREEEEEEDEVEEEEEEEENNTNVLPPLRPPLWPYQMHSLSQMLKIQKAKT